MFNVVFFGSDGKALASKLDASSLLVGDGLYYKSSQLSSKTFSNEFASLISGYYTFAESNLKTFTGSLTSLQNGERMFSTNGSFTTFSADMPNLNNGTYMFYNTPLLASFVSNLPNLRTGSYMFQNAIALPSFSAPVPKLTNGMRMFDGCASLETFDSVLPSLENGSYMFQGCKLSGRSVRNIVESLPMYETQHSITIGINCTEDIEGQREFLRETGYNTFEEIEDALAAKGWKVVWHFQGFPSGWRPVEYLESTGTQWMNTGYTPTSDGDSVEHILQFTRNDVRQLMGANSASSYFGCNASGNYELAISAGFSGGPIPVGNKDLLKIGFPSTSLTTLTVNQESLLSKPESLGRDNYTLYALPDGSWSCYLRLFSITILSSNGSILHNYSPCIDNVGNPCMYDKVSKTSLYNKGTGQFLVPTTSATFSLRQPRPEFAQITPTGVRKLYHLPYDYEGTLEEYVEAEGYKPLIENERPEEGNWAPVWEETEDAVVLTWSEVLNSVEDEA